MLSKVKKKVLNLLYAKGYILLKTKEFNEKIDYFRQVLVESRKNSKKEKKIESIVFSKDRAMQLHAFLTSYSAMVSGRSTMYVLYKASNKKHSESYEFLKEIFKEPNFIFIEESDFRKQLIHICESSTAQSIALFVDDIIVTHPIDYNKILEIDLLHNVVSLGRGRELNYSIVLQKKLKLPEFKLGENGFIYFRWDYTNEYNDWTYPIGVGANFFDRDELVVMLNQTAFKAPNSLETNLQIYKPMFIHRFGVCMEKICCVAVHANLVQSEGVNPDLGSFSTDELLVKWEQGWIIDLAKFYHISGDIAQLQTYEFVKRHK